MILRLLSQTLFLSIPLGNLFKKYIVKLLMTGKKKIDGSVSRQFEFLEDKMTVHEDIIKPRGCQSIGHYGKCRTIHMASSGYYLKQDELRPSQARLVEFRTQG